MSSKIRLRVLTPTYFGGRRLRPGEIIEVEREELANGGTPRWAVIDEERISPSCAPYRDRQGFWAKSAPAAKPGAREAEVQELAFED